MKTTTVTPSYRKCAACCNNRLAVVYLIAGLFFYVNLHGQEIEGVGKFTGDFRARFESADQESRDASDALTLRSRVGFESLEMEGFKLFVEGSDVQALDDDSYLGFPGPGPTVIADPEGTDLNRATVTYSNQGFTAVVGRQRIILDGARFVGNVGWRQREQTFDAATLKFQDGPLTASIGHIDRVKRIFGPDAPSGALRTFDSDSQLINGSYQLTDNLAVGVYAYLLEFDNARANSSDTTGFTLKGSRELDSSTRLTYHLEAAQQRSGTGNPSKYSTQYQHVALGLNLGSVNLTGGLEILGSDNGVGFKTPLATLHKFNGWADAFLATPADGLEDLYVSVGTKVNIVDVLVAYHDFGSRENARYFGGELDIQAAWTVADRVKCIAKFANLQGRNGVLDTDKFWLEANFSF